MTVLYIIIAILILLLMILIHEFGHYIVGKLLKFKINEFSIGFGPKIFSKKNKKTGEVFSLRLLPLGGFCAFEGEDSVEETAPKSDKEDENKDKSQTDIFNDKNDADNGEKSDIGKENANSSANGETASKNCVQLKSFNDQPPWKRILVLLAGATFNFVSGIIFAFIFLCVGGTSSVTVQQKNLTKDGVDINEALLVGDEIVAVDGQYFDVMHSFSDRIAAKNGDSFILTVIRDGETLDVVVRKGSVYDKGSKTEYEGLGIVTMAKSKPMNGWKALAMCVPYTLKLSWLILGTFGQLLTGRLSLRTVTGPVTTIKFMADAAKMSWLNIFVLLPMISANLAIFNVLPIPALDGSKVVFAVIEWIRGKPISRKVEAYIHAAGFVFLMGFCVLVEILHLF